MSSDSSTPATPRGRRATTQAPTARPSGPAPVHSMDHGTDQDGRPADRPRINLALQGGGSHGAFTWGVLDALLEDGRLEFDGVSGTSAGAMNAVVMACGHARGGREGARQALRAFWGEISGRPGCLGAAEGLASTPATAGATALGPPAGSSALPFFSWPGASPFASPVSAMPMWPAWMFNLNQWPLYNLWDSLWRSLSPYQFNPLNLNPLRQVLEKHVDLEALRRGSIRVFVTATAVSSGQPRVFGGDELSVEAVLASACLPQMFQAVQIDGELGPDGQPESFWDGGFAGNPAIWPLIYNTDTSDVLLVQINPLVRPGVPRTAADIADRVNEITFNASLVAEMRAIAFVKKLISRGKLDLSDYKRLHVHRVADEAGMAPFGASSKLNTDPRLLQELFTLGRAAAQRWLETHLEDVGQRSSTDIEPVYLAPRGQG